MKIKVYLLLCLRIVMLFSMPMVLSLVNFNKIFNDRPLRDDQNTSNMFDSEYVWTGAHCWAFWGMVIIFLLSLVDAIIFCIKVVKKNYPELK